MSQLITLRRSDPDFQKYLLGTFSKSERAIPVQSLNVNSNQEIVTFRIEDIKNISFPSAFSLVAQILKLKSFILVALPLFLILSKNFFDESGFDGLLALLSALGALSLHAAVNLRNDYQDHLRGLDRVHPRSGSRVIQSGWLSAQQVLWLSRFFFFAGIFLGLPAIFVFPELLGIIAVLAILGIVAISSYKMGIKYRRWAEFMAFFLLGPLLTVGFQIAIGGGFDVESVLIGISTGWMAVFVLHLKNFEQIMVNSQAGFNNTISWLGFEGAKKFLLFSWSVGVSWILLYHYIFSSVTWTLIFTITLVVFSYMVFNYIRALQSPVGSLLTTVCEKSQRIILFIMALWALEAMSYLWVLEVASTT